MFSKKERVRKIPLHDFIFTSLDIETTGLNPVEDKIIEVAGIKFDVRGVEKGEFSTLVNPETSIPYGVTRIHGITEKMVKGKPKIREVLHLLKNFLSQTSALLFHNASFDLSFLGKAFYDEHIPIPSLPVIDTLLLSQKYLSGKEGHSLQVVFRRISDKNIEFHHALDDSFAVKEIFLHLIKKMSVSSLSEILREEEIIYSNQGFLPGIKLTSNYEFINKAKRSKTPLKIEYLEPNRIKFYTILINEIVKVGKKIYLYTSCLPSYEKKFFELSKIQRFSF